MILVILQKVEACVCDILSVTSNYSKGIKSPRVVKERDSTLMRGRQINPQAVLNLKCLLSATLTSVLLPFAS